MNDPLDSDPMTARLRSALQALAATADAIPRDRSEPIRARAATAAVPSTRWLTSAAAIVLVGAGGLVLVQPGRDPTDEVSTDDEAMTVLARSSTGSVLADRSGAGSGPVVENVPIVVRAPNGTLPDAIMRGRVVLHHGCTSLTSSDAGQRTPQPILWEHGTTFDSAAGGTVIAPDGTRIPLGSEIETGGGYVSANAFGDSQPDVAEQLDRCLDRAGRSDEIAIVGGDITVTADPNGPGPQD